MPLEAVDLAFRTGAVALLLLLAALLLRDYGRSPAGRLGAAFALGSAAFAISTAAGFASQVTWWRGALIAVSTGNVIVFWLFARTLFDDRFALRWWHAAAWALLTALSFANCSLLAAATPLSRLTATALTVIALGFNALAVAQTIASWSGDLVERRRRLRIFIVGSAAIYSIVNGILRLALTGEPPPPLLSVANAATLIAIVSVVAWHLTRATGSELFVTAAPTRLAPEADEIADPERPEDLKLIATLQRLMQHERLYRHDGLTIGTLAAKLAVPEYRLRRVINQRLGYRNFNAFLNSYRIAEAKAALTDPTQSDVPVTTIALDAGFQSLGPFNRAFKTETGLTPTEYRRAGPSEGQRASQSA